MSEGAINFCVMICACVASAAIVGEERLDWDGNLQKGPFWTLVAAALAVAIGHAALYLGEVLR